MAAADVVNHAFVLLGDTETITDITDNVTMARAANVIYNKTRQSELRKHPWNFARKSVQIAKDATDPDVRALEDPGQPATENPVGLDVPRRVVVPLPRIP